MKKEKQFLKECFLQKTNQFDALKVLHEKGPVLTLGAKLVLDFKDMTESGKMPIVAKYGNDIIGILSEEDSKDIKPYFYAGWAGDLFQCRISRYNADADENKRFSIAIHIKEKGANAEVQGPAQDGGDPNGT